MNKLNLPPFYIGQKVVCIKDSWYHTDEVSGFSPKKNNIYTVNNISYCDFHKIWYLGLKEMNQDEEFISTNFSPIKELKAPMLTFKQIKETEKEEVLILN